MLQTEIAEEAGVNPVHVRNTLYSLPRESFEQYKVDIGADSLYGQGRITEMNEMLPPRR